MKQLPNWYSKLTAVAIVFAFTVVVVGAFTRLSDAGLGCPDWPGCYGHLTVPQSEAALQKAMERYPHQPVEVAKAWAEMGHRYLAGILGLLIFLLAGLAWRYRRALDPVSLKVALLLVGLVIFQAVLGMWTVTWLLLPTIVLAHLLGGITILALLWWLMLRTIDSQRSSRLMPPQLSVRWLRPWAILAIGLVFAQIFLGGWTSANYAALICPDFPTCQGQWLPPLNFREAFTFTLPIGVNYEGGLFTNDARVTIHYIHRIGALIVLLYLVLFFGLLWRSGAPLLRILGCIMLLVLVLQLTLGILNVKWLLPLSLAVAHNGVAALLLLIVVKITHNLYLKN